jgi:hypothetical protein
MVFPVILGSGKKLFGGMDEKKSMKLISSQTVGDGVGILIYEPKQAETLSPPVNADGQ